MMVMQLGCSIWIQNILLFDLDYYVVWLCGRDKRVAMFGCCLLFSRLHSFWLLDV